MHTALLLALIACTPSHKPAVPVSERPPALAHLSLGESWPVETTLDQPDIADAWQVWVEMIDGAKERIDLAQFYLQQDTEHEDRIDAVVAALHRATARGVKVRFLADAKFGKQYPEELNKLAEDPGVTLRLYDVGALTGGILHAKYFVVDGREAWVGSQNFDWRSLEHIEELGLRFDEPRTVAQLLSVYEYDWAAAAGEPRPAAGENPPPLPVPVSWRGQTVQLRLAASPSKLEVPGVPLELPLLLELIDNAQHDLNVAVLDYAITGYDRVAWTGLDERLRAAAARGVQVHLLVSDWQKSPYKVGDVQALARVEHIDVRFLDVPAHSSGHIPFARVLHSKFATADGEHVWVSTSNWSHDYFDSSRNIALFVDGAPFATRLTELHSTLWESAYAEVVDPDATYTAPRVK